MGRFARSIRLSSWLGAAAFALTLVPALSAAAPYKFPFEIEVLRSACFPDLSYPDKARVKIAAEGWKPVEPASNDMLARAVSNLTTRSSDSKLGKREQNFWTYSKLVDGRQFYVYLDQSKVYSPPTMLDGKEIAQAMMMHINTCQLFDFKAEKPVSQQDIDILKASYMFQYNTVFGYFCRPGDPPDDNRQRSGEGLVGLHLSASAFGG